MSSTAVVIIVVVVVVVLALAAVGAVLARRRRSQRLREQFGPEYERRLEETGSQRAAESDLRAREKRHRRLEIRGLEPAERSRYEQSWQEIQRGFVDDPADAVRQADHLVVVIMRHRGYPVDDFEQRAEDISVEHPEVVAHYRAGRRVADANQRGEAGTEDLRHAVTAYRSLVDALLDGGSSAGGHDRTPTTPKEAER